MIVSSHPHSETGDAGSSLAFGLGRCGARRLLLLFSDETTWAARYLCTEYPSRIAAAPLLTYTHPQPWTRRMASRSCTLASQCDPTRRRRSSLVEPLHRRRRPVSAPLSSKYGRQIESALDSGDLRGQVASSMSPSRCRPRTGCQLGFDSTSSGQGQQRVTKLLCSGRNMLAATLWPVVSCRGRDAFCVLRTQYIRTLLGVHAHCSLQVAYLGSSQQPPKKRSFSRLILGAGGGVKHRGLAPVLCTPSLPTPPPPPLVVFLPSLIRALSPSRSTDGLDQGGPFTSTLPF